MSEVNTCDKCNAEYRELYAFDYAVLDKDARGIGGKTLKLCPRCFGEIMGVIVRKPKAEEQSILAEAQSIVEGSRNDDYGTPERNHIRIAQLWSSYLGVEVKPRDVCAMMILVKISRDRFSPKRDNAVDIAGYADLMDKMEGL